MKKFLLGALVGATFMGLCDRRENSVSQRKEAHQAWVDGNIDSATSKNRSLMCDAIRGGLPLDLMPYNTTYASARYYVGRSGGGDQHSRLSFADSYGLTKDCEGGLTPDDVIKICKGIGVEISSTQIYASVVGSGEEVEESLSCLK